MILTVWRLSWSLVTQWRSVWKVCRKRCQHLVSAFVLADSSSPQLTLFVYTRAVKQSVRCYFIRVRTCTCTGVNETRLKLRVQPDTFRRCIKRSVATRFANWSNRHWASVVVTVAKSAGPGTASVLLNFSTHWLALFMPCSFELTVDFLDYMDDILALQSAGVCI